MLVLADVPLDVAVIAFVLAILLWAGRNLFVNPLTWTLQQIPVVGGAAAGFVEGMLGSLAGFAVQWAEAGIGGLTAAINLPTVALQSFAGLVVTGIESTVSALLLLASQIGSDLAAVAGRLGQLETAAVNAASAITIALDRIGQLFATVAAIETTVIPNAVASTIAKAEDFTAQQVAQAEHIAAVGVAGAIQSAETFVGAETQRALKAEATLQAAAQAQIDALGRTLGGDVAGLTGTLGKDVASLEGLIGGVSDLVAPLVAANLITRLATLATEVATMDKECVTPQCDYLGPQLPNLNGLQDIATIGLIIAMVSGAIRDPQGTADEMAGAASFVRGSVNSVLSPLLGFSV